MLYEVITGGAAVARHRQPHVGAGRVARDERERDAAMAVGGDRRIGARHAREEGRRDLVNAHPVERIAGRTTAAGEQRQQGNGRDARVAGAAAERLP